MAAPLPLSRPRARSVSLPRPVIPFGFGFALLLVALSLLPYLLAYAWTPPGRHFAGFFFIADDATTYLAKMRQGADGAWLWNDPYTSEPHQGVFLFGFYLLFGHLAALMHLPLIAAFHLARITGGIALILAIDLLARRTLAPESRRLGLVLAVLGSGLGFLAQLAHDPRLLGVPLQALDLHLPELTGWYSLLAIPHFTWAAALIVLTFIGLKELADGISVRRIAVPALTLNALALIHPQMVPVIMLVWITDRAVRLAWGERPEVRSLFAEGAPFLAAAPLVAYNALVLFRNPTISQWAEQWRHQAPDPFSLTLSLGLPLVAATAGIVVTFKRRDRNLVLLAVWPPVVFALLYLPNPVNIQRRLLDAIYVPLGLLAAVGLRAALALLQPRRARRLERALLPVFCIASALVLAIALRFAAGTFPEIYLPEDDWQALAWLQSHHAAKDRALSSPQAGLYLPAYSGVSVYVGHYSETLNYFSKIQTVDVVLQRTTPEADVRTFLQANRISLLYWGPVERQSLTFEPSTQPYLRLIEEVGSVRIYRVQLDTSLDGAARGEG